MANTNAPFIPTTSASLSVTGTAASVTLPTTGEVAMLFNDGSATCYWKTGAATATAAATDTPIGGGAIIIYTLDPAATVLSAIAATGASTTLRITRGYGS